MKRILLFLMVILPGVLLNSCTKEKEKCYNYAVDKYYQPVILDSTWIDFAYYDTVAVCNLTGDEARVKQSSFNKVDTLFMEAHTVNPAGYFISRWICQYYHIK